MIADRQKIWHHRHVVDAALPDFAIRTYLEQSDLRRWLVQISNEIDLIQVSDVGAGYGRLTPVLTEFAPQVIAFERESVFVTDIKRLLPGVEARRIEHLSRLPAPGGSFQFVLSFTVLQHLSDQEVLQVGAELKRIVAAPGYILLCEATDVLLRYEEDDSPEGGVTIGRPIEDYQSLLAPLELIATAPRRVEQSYPSHSGTYMLFKNTSVE